MDENQETNVTFPNCRLTEMGKEYMGMVRKRKTGKPCMNWNDFSDMTKYPEVMSKILPLSVDSKEMKSFQEFFINRDPRSYVNFCRNPGWGQRPWCFVSKDPAIKWEYCDIPFCKNRGSSVRVQVDEERLGLHGEEERVLLGVALRTVAQIFDARFHDREGHPFVPGSRGQQAQLLS
ncbi:unnamed protein product [Darwinula stevensoni]|uniref:Kringle domain-containing protein n=1 Tax=Darwinula stevensoni TaxID=69355 RepID=A0A7R9A7A7_9CRUS|nr:unnamed protein product [Darwinula stevensoni]CAG0890948.1 unnamed protein product [Darwinula stevensoni]